MAVEVLAVDAFIWQTLTGDATLAALVGARVYELPVPEKDPATDALPVYPLIGVSLLQAPNSVGSGGVKLMTLPQVQIEVVGRGSGYAALQAAADRVEALMQNVAATAVVAGTDTFTILGSYQIRQIQRPLVERGVRYSCLGAVYGFFV